MRSPSSCLEALDARAARGFVRRLDRERRRGSGASTRRRRRDPRAVRRARGRSWCRYHCRQRRWLLRAQPERMADGVGEFGAIERIEMKLLHAVAGKRLYLLDGDARGDQAARLGVLVKAAEALVQPLRNPRAAALARSAAPAESA